VNTVNPDKPLGVIFDIDGVLVDSYHAHLASWQRLATECDVPFTDGDFARTFGMTSREIIRTYWPEAHHSDEAVETLDGQKEAWYRELIRENFPMMDGAIELIDALHEAGIVIGAGSSGPPENVHLALNSLGKRSLFQAIVTGMDVTRGKIGRAHV